MKIGYFQRWALAPGDKRREHIYLFYSYGPAYFQMDLVNLSIRVIFFPYIDAESLPARGTDSDIVLSRIGKFCLPLQNIAYRKYLLKEMNMQKLF